MAGSMMGNIRYSVPQTAALSGGYQNWQPYTILPQQMMQGVGVEGGYSMSQLAAQMGQLGLSAQVGFETTFVNTSLLFKVLEFLLVLSLQKIIKNLKLVI